MSSLNLLYTVGKLWEAGLNKQVVNSQPYPGSCHHFKPQTLTSCFLIMTFYPSTLTSHQPYSGQNTLPAVRACQLMLFVFLNQPLIYFFPPFSWDSGVYLLHCSSTTSSIVGLHDFCCPRLRNSSTNSALLLPHSGLWEETHSSTPMFLQVFFSLLSQAIPLTVIHFFISCEVLSNTALHLHPFHRAFPINPGDDFISSFTGENNWCH